MTHGNITGWWLRGLAYLPLPVLHVLGAGLGVGLYGLPNSVRRSMQVNLTLCYPQLTQPKRQRLLRASLRETAKTLLELAALWHQPWTRLAPYTQAVTGEAAVQAALARRQGVIFALPHLGAWEYMGLYLGNRYPFTALYLPPRLAALAESIHHARERTGAKLLPLSEASSLRVLHRALRAGETVGILPDQEAKRGGGVFAPFFHTPALTMTLLGRLARATDAVVIIAFAERLPRGQGYHLHFIPTPPEIAAADPVQAATALNQAIAASIAVAPSQYQWAYHRFRRLPEGGKRTY